MAKHSIKTKHRAIVLANLDLLTRCPNLDFDGLQPGSPESADELTRLTKTCWACGYGDITTTRCHVQARTHGGSDEPGNFYLLCSRCHDCQPDGLDRATQDAWLVSREGWDVVGLKRVQQFLADLKAKLPWLEDDMLTLLLKPLLKWISEGNRKGASFSPQSENAILYVASKLQRWHDGLTGKLRKSVA